jgi:hypothetical protein
MAWQTKRSIKRKWTDSMAFVFVSTNSPRIRKCISHLSPTVNRFLAFSYGEIAPLKIFLRWTGYGKAGGFCCRNVLIINPITNMIAVEKKRRSPVSYLHQMNYFISQNTTF